MAVRTVKRIVPRNSIVEIRSWRGYSAPEGDVLPAQGGDESAAESGEDQHEVEDGRGRYDAFEHEGKGGPSRCVVMALSRSEGRPSPGTETAMGVQGVWDFYHSYVRKFDRIRVNLVVLFEAPGDGCRSDCGCDVLPWCTGRLGGPF